MQAFPEVAGELFKREHTFRNYVNSLDQTVTHYNRLKTNTKPVECLLVAGEVADIDAQLERAEHALNWNSDGGRVGFAAPVLPSLLPNE